MKKILSIISFAALAIGLLGSCKKEDSTVSVTGVTLDRTTLEITVGDPNVRLTAIVVPENATDKTISWSSDRTDVATVDNEGNVHAVAPGNANITVTATNSGKTATCIVTVSGKPIETIADVLATIDGGFPQGTGTMMEPPTNAWVYGSDRYSFVVQSGQYLILSFYYSEYFDPITGAEGNATGLPLTTNVTQGENCYTATLGQNTLTFNMTAGKLTSIYFSSTNASMQENYGGSYDTFHVDLKMEGGYDESNWNKIAILIKGTDVVSGKYYFNESTDENFTGNLEELVENKGTELTDGQIESINQNEGLRIVKEDLGEETKYKTVLVVSNSAGYSKTIVKTHKTGQAPPPM